MTPWFDPQNKRDYFCIIWNLLRKCNCNCLGCTYHDNTPVKLIDVDKVINFIKNNFDFTKSYKQITLFGGEPTLHPEFKKIIDELYKLNVYLILYTNLTADIDTYKYCQDRKVHLTITYHHNAFKNVMDFVNKLMYLDASDISLIYVKHKGYENNYKLLKNMFGEDKTTLIAIHRTSQFVDTPVLNINKTCDGKIDGKKANWADIVETDKNHFTGWKCVAGKNSFYIEQNGDVFACEGIGQEYYRKCLYNKLGNIEDTKFKFTPKETICPCRWCGFEAFLTKENINKNIKD